MCVPPGLAVFSFMKYVNIKLCHWTIDCPRLLLLKERTNKRVSGSAFRESQSLCGLGGLAVKPAVDKETYRSLQVQGWRLVYFTVERTHLLLRI